MNPELLPRPDETLDVLSRTLRILQRRRGHRAASDDVALAWAAARASPGARRVLDLGCGKGTVALLLLRRLPEACAVGVEAFAESHALAMRNAVLNGLSDRFEPRLGDLRDPAVLAGEQPFDVVTGAPPFMPVGTGVMPADPQRAAGRFELRGGVEGYALAAARHLAPSGRAVLLMDGAGGARAQAAVRVAGLHCRRVTGVRPRPGRPETYWIVEAAHEPGGCLRETLAMRGEVGDAWSADWQRVRAEMDLP